MGRKSKRQIIEEQTTVLGIEFRCGACGEKVIAKISGYDFSASESDCDLCGGHGSVSVDLTCPKCNYQHLYVNLNSW